LEALLLDENPAIQQMAAQALITATAGDFTVLRRFLASAIPLARVTAAGRVLRATR
jgi:hypothetical protein